MNRREVLRWSGSFVFVLGLHAGAVGLALGWTHAEAPYAPPPAAVMLDMAPLPAAPQATPSEAPPAPDLSEAVPEPQEPPPVDLKPMKIEVELAEPPPPVEIPLAEVVLPPPDPPPPLDLKPPDKPKPVERPKPPQPKPWLGDLVFVIGDWLLAGAALLTLWSGYQYLRAAWPVLKAGEGHAVELPAPDAPRVDTPGTDGRIPPLSRE